MKCPLCSNDRKGVDADLCPIHDKSLENLKIAHKQWNVAYRGLSLDEFLKRIEGLPETGHAAKEVAGYLRGNPSRWK